MNNRHLFLTVLEAEVQGEGPGTFTVWWVRFLVHGWGLLTVSSHGWSGGRLSGVSY